MSDRVVYDIVEAGPTWWFAVAGLVPAVLFPPYFLWLRDGKLPRRLFPSPWLDHRRWLFTGMAAFTLLFGLLWAAGVTYSTLTEHYNACRLLREGGATVVEGKVERFEPEPSNGKGGEHLSVGGVAFEYSSRDAASGFRWTATQGGPMREGLDVRIHYAELSGRRTILRLEVRE